MIISGIDENGQEYISGFLEPLRLDESGLQISRGYLIENNHAKQKATLMRAPHHHGAPRNITVLEVVKDDIVTPGEVAALLAKHGLTEWFSELTQAGKGEAQT